MNEQQWMKQALNYCHNKISILRVTGFLYYHMISIDSILTCVQIYFSVKICII